MGVLHFLAYAAGMGVILTALTAALALAQTSLVGRMRRVGRHVEKAGGLLLAMAGAYVAYYGWYTLRSVYDGDTDPGGPAQLGYEFSAWMSDRIRTGPLRVGLLTTLAILVIIAVAFLRRAPHTRRP